MLSLHFWDKQYFKAIIFHVMYHTYCFLYINPHLDDWEKSHLVRVGNPFDVLLL